MIAEASSYFGCIVSVKKSEIAAMSKARHGADIFAELSKTYGLVIVWLVFCRGSDHREECRMFSQENSARVDGFQKGVYA